MPRVLTLTDGLADAIIELMTRTGCPFRAASVKAGVPIQTAHEWRLRGEGRHARTPTPKLAAFAKRIAEAEAEAHILALARIRQAMTGGQQTTETRIERRYQMKPDGTRGRLLEEKEITVTRREPRQWTAGAWWLERTMPELYGRRDRLQLEGDITTRAIVEIPPELPDAATWQALMTPPDDLLAASVPHRPVVPHGGNGKGNGANGSGG